MRTDTAVKFIRGQGTVPTVAGTWGTTNGWTPRFPGIILEPMRLPAAPSAALLLLLAACGGRPLRYTVVAPANAQAVSLLGDTLWSVPVDPGSGPEAVERLRQARAEAARSPTNLLAQLHLARSTAAIGRLREAVDLLTSAKNFQDPQVFRYRGEYLLRLRRLDLAIADFRLAGQLSMGAQGLPEEVERTDGTRSVSTVFFRTIFLLGVALYCRGDFAAAGIALAEAAKRALTPDDMAQSTFWLFLAVRRTRGADEAKLLLTGMEDDRAVSDGFHEQALLLGFRGMLPSDTVRARAMASRATAERTLYSYGIGYVLLMQDRREEAESWFEHARLSPDWTTLPYLAAESELARMRRRP